MIKTGKYISEKIFCVRFPLMLGIILIHSANYASLETLFPAHSSAMTALLLEKGINHCLLSAIVPLYFFISGFLFLKCDDILSLRLFLGKMKKRFSSLLIPYLLWNVIAFLLRYAMQAFSGNTEVPAFTDLAARLFILPELMPLWFIRNLILIVILSPAICYCIRKFPILSLILLIAANYWEYLYGIFFFGVGVMTSQYLYNIDFTTRIKRWLNIISLIWLAITAFRIGACCCGIEIHSPIAILDSFIEEYILLLMGIIFFFNLFSRIRTSSVLLNSTFFIYAFHGIISPYIIKGVSLLRPNGFAAVAGCYILDFILIASFSILAYMISIRIFPQFTRILVGNRLPSPLSGINRIK